MQTFKFRAWNIQDKEMEYIGQSEMDLFWFEENGVREIEGGIGSGMYRSFFFMVFSGLKDKNGKEIYEGDKCKVQDAMGVCTTSEVVFVDGCFELHFYSPTILDGKYTTRDYLKCWTVNRAVEIIGNIYE